MVNPLIVKNAAVAAKGAATGAAKIAASDKAAKAIGGAFKSIEETTKMGGFQDLLGFSENIKNTGPMLALAEIFMGKFTAGTTEAMVNLMISGMDSMSSPAGVAAMGALTSFVSVLVNNLSALINVVSEMETLNLVLENLFESMTKINEAFAPENVVDVLSGDTTDEEGNTFWENLIDGMGGMLGGANTW